MAKKSYSLIRSFPNKTSHFLRFVQMLFFFNDIFFVHCWPVVCVYQSVRVIHVCVRCLKIIAHWPPSLNSWKMLCWPSVKTMMIMIIISHSFIISYLLLWLRFLVFGWCWCFLFHLKTLLNFELCTTSFLFMCIGSMAFFYYCFIQMTNVRWMMIIDNPLHHLAMLGGGKSLNEIDDNNNNKW